MSRTRARTWLLRLATVSFAVFVALLIAEAVLRMRMRVDSEPRVAGSFESVAQFCAPRHHCLVPNGHYDHSSYEYSYSWDNNGLGMRDREHPRTKPPGTFRILVLGDSFVQGHGVRVEDTMVTRLEASLNQPPRAQTVEVLNGGVFGYSPLLEYLYLRDTIGELQPDLVVVAVFLGNDVGEDAFYARKAHVSADGESLSFDDREWPWSKIVAALDGGETPVAAAPAAAPGPGGPWASAKDLLRNLRTVALLRSRLEDVRYPARRAREFALVKAHRGDVEFDLGLINYPALSRDQRLAYWQPTKQNLERIATLCREHGARMVLLVIPPFERLTGETELDEPYAIVDQLGRDLAVPVIQLLPDFLGQPPDALYYRFDRHWTAEGNRRAAQVVDQELRRLDVLPEGGAAH